MITVTTYFKNKDEDNDDDDYYYMTKHGWLAVEAVYSQ